MTSGVCFADDYTQVDRLLQTGRAGEALSRADRYLAATPRDPQMRFLRGVALASTGRTGEAIAAYTALTQDFPELPEPYNNLAVLLAGQDQLEQARAALEQALRAQPGYAIAHENLGDIQLRLAVRAWSRARALDPGLTTIAPKLAAARAAMAASGPGVPAGLRP